MPTIRKRGLRRLPTDFTAIDKGELTRWNLGQVLVEGEVTLLQKRGAPNVMIWPSWSAWAAVYGRCRSQYLVHYRQRHGPDEVPGAELLFAAIEGGKDPGAESTCHPKIALRPDGPVAWLLCDPRLIFASLEPEVAARAATARGEHQRD